MTPGTIEDALVLAKARWAQFNDFDLEDSCWAALFQNYPAGEILEAVKLSKTTCDPRPEKRYARFVHILENIDSRARYVQN